MARMSGSVFLGSIAALLVSTLVTYIQPLTHPSSCYQGYLRAGKALLLFEKPDKALDVYAYALKSLGERHPQREVSTCIEEQTHLHPLPLASSSYFALALRSD